jgi:hypothetical protein
MSEELKVEVPVTPEPEQSQAPELTPIEVRAVEMGWRPKSEFSGDEDDFIDAKEFVRRKPLFEKIDTQSRQIKAVTKALSEFKAHYSKVHEIAVTEALQKLKNERKEAIASGDGERFEQLDEKITATERQVDEIREAAKAPIVSEEPVAVPEFNSWKSRNSWYDSVGYMRKFADEVGTPLALKGVPPEAVLKQVEEAVRKEFPHKFRNPNKDTAPGVETSKPGSARASKDEVDMSDLERKIMNDLVRAKVLTKEQYIADLKRMKK